MCLICASSSDIVSSDYSGFSGRFDHETLSEKLLQGRSQLDLAALQIPVDADTALIAPPDSGPVRTSASTAINETPEKTLGTSDNGNANTPQATSAVSFNDNAYNTPMRGLLSDTAWSTGNTLSYHLQYSDYDGDGTNDWLEDGAATAIRSAFDQWERLGNLAFEEVGNAGSANLVERIGSADGALGYHFFPDTGDFQSEGEYNKFGFGWNSTGLQQGGYGYITLIHELGHGLGLEHPHDTDIFSGIANGGSSGGNILGNSDSLADYYLNQGIYTTMSYNDGWAINGGPGGSVQGYGYQGTPMAFDIAAYQIKYGANMSTATGNDSYTLANANTAGTYFSSIWDAGGTDEITYTGGRNANIFLDDATIDESATGGGLLSFVEGIHGGFTIAQNAVIENASSGGGADFLAGNEIANNMDGGNGDDVLIGQDGADNLSGDGGDDLIFGDYLDDSILFAADATVGGGISIGSGVVSAPQGSVNNTISTAIDLSSSFALTANGNIENATTVPHVTVNGTGNDQYDVFAVTVNNPFAVIVVDVDNTSAGFDSDIILADSSGAGLRRSDDSAVGQGASGSTTDYGVDTSTDSYLVFQPGEAGTYYIQMSSWTGSSPGVVPVGATYQMNVSVYHEYQTSKYAHFADYFDLSASGGAADVIDGGTGDDEIYGGEGNDSLTGGAGADVIDGGEGTDWVRFAAATSAVNVNLFSGNGSGGHAAGDSYANLERIAGSAHNDTLTGTDDINRIEGSGGNDTIYGRSGNDVLLGGAGADILNGGGAIDWVYYTDSSSAVSVNLGTGFGSGGTAQGDTYSQIERVLGSDYNDVLYGSGLGNYLRGAAGADSLYGGSGTDLLSGGEGGDILNGGDGFDWAYYIFSTSGVTVDLDANSASGGEAAGDSFASIERIRGSDYADTFTGDSAKNWFRGGDGDDTMRGGTGRDLFQGEGGADTYIFEQGDEFARIRGFEDDTDMLDLTDYGFASQAAAAGFMSQSGASVQFDYAGERIIIENMNIAALQDDILV